MQFASQELQIFKLAYIRAFEGSTKLRICASGLVPPFVHAQVDLPGAWGSHLHHGNDDELDCAGKALLRRLLRHEQVQKAAQNLQGARAQRQYSASP